MQDQYVGDIGDFGKYGLLRHLTGMREYPKPKDVLRLGVVWYRFPDEQPKDPKTPNKRDGSLTGYLCDKRDNHEKFRKCDTELYDALHRIVMEEKIRNIAKVQESGILPGNPLYYHQFLPDPLEHTGDALKSAREDWLKDALKTTADAKLVFVDPDNGISPKRTRPWHKNGLKYVFMEDLCQFTKRGQSLVIYHHLGRHRKAPEQIKNGAERLQESLELPVWALRYHRGTSRVYFIIAQECHRAVLEKRLASFADSPWCAKPSPHFKKVI